MIKVQFYPIIHSRNIGICPAIVDSVIIYLALYHLCNPVYPLWRGVESQTLSPVCVAVKPTIAIIVQIAHQGTDLCYGSLLIYNVVFLSNLFNDSANPFYR